MKDFLPYVQNAGTIAFVALGIATGIGWARRRNGSQGFLALAIVLLSSVSLLGSIPALLHFNPPLLSQVSLLGFMGCGYALLLYRNSLIPLPRRWHAVAAVAVAATSGGFLAVSFTRQLKTSAATADIPVVTLTARAMRGDREESFKAGCAGYIAKPIDNRTLGEQVRGFLASSAAGEQGLNQAATA
jgi:hypothetical protein